MSLRHLDVLSCFGSDDHRLSVNLKTWNLRPRKNCYLRKPWTLRRKNHHNNDQLISVEVVHRSSYQVSSQPFTLRRKNRSVAIQPLLSPSTTDDDNYDQIRTCLGIARVPCFTLSKEQEQEIDIMKNILQHSPELATGTTSVLGNLIEQAAMQTKGYSYLTVTNDQLDDEQEKHKDYWDQEESNSTDHELSCYSEEQWLLQSGQQCYKTENNFPDPERYLEKIQLIWPSNLPNYLLKVAIDLMPITREPSDSVYTSAYYCDLCGMKNPFELLDEVGYNIDRGYYYSFPQSILIGKIIGSKSFCRTCSRKVTRNLQLVGPKLFAYSSQL